MLFSQLTEAGLSENEELANQFQKRIGSFALYL